MNWDNDAAVKFLRRWAMNGPWPLTAIDTNVTATKPHGRLFQSDEEPQLRAWLNEQGENLRNVYFSVNSVIESKFYGKAGREDIERVTHFHVDIDPRAGEDLDAERARIKKLIEEPPKGVPKPTWAVFSGGGYQLFWELEEPIEIGGDINKAEAAKLYNLQLEFLFKADNCHNIDRIMRLSGTVNVPDKKKLAKGRTKQLAKVVFFEEGRVYPLSAFTKAAGVQSSDKSGGFSNGNNVVISGNLKRAESIEEIIVWAEEGGGVIPDNILMLIGQGDLPDEPDKYESRSNALFACCCGLVRAKLTDDHIYSIITDPTWKISESVLDKGSRIAAYAKRQIARAKDDAVHPKLAKMNERHAVIRNYGGKCIVMEEVYDAHMKRENLTIQSFTCVRNSYMNQKISMGLDSNGNEKFMELGKWWLQHQDRMQYNSIVFSPNGNVEGSYNLWRGFACEAIPGDCSLLLAHIHKNICGGDDTYNEYLLSWMARAVQFPDSTGDTAVILRGDQGTGKGVMIKALGSLFGRHFLQVSNSNHLVGHFNKHLRDCVVLFADEAFFAGDKKHEGILKALVTEEYLVVEAKGVDVEPSPNFIHLLMASNNDWVVPAGMNERRFFVLDVKSHHMQDSAYFNKITDELYNKGGRQALLHMLQSRDISDFNHRSIPKTTALQEQKELSMSPEESWWYNKLVTGNIMSGGDQWLSRVSRAHVQFDYVNYMKDLGQQRRCSPAIVGRFLSKVNPQRFPKKMQEVTMDHVTGEDRMLPIYIFPDLDSCRAYWDSKYFKGEWILDVEETPGQVPF